MSITITAETYQAWGVAAPVSDNTSFKGWCSILNGVYTGYTAQYITRKIHYVQTGISVYNDSGIQSYFDKERTIESSIYVDSANFTDDFNIELEIASIFNPTSDRNFYYYVEYIDSNDKTLTYFPEQGITDNGTWEKKSYYGICRANSLKQDNSFVYTTDKFEEGTAIDKFDANGQLLTISVGRYITLKLSKDDSVKKVSVTMELYSETEKIGKIPKLNIAYFVLTNKDKTTNRILRIEIPVEYLSAFQDANISYGLIIVSEQTNYGLNKKFDFKVDCEPLQDISDNIESTKDKYYFFDDFSNGNIEFLFPSRDSEGKQPSLSNKTLRDIKPQLRYGEKIIELLDENSNVIWTDDQFTQSFDNDNHLTKAKYTLQKEFFDNIIINNVSPEDCYGNKSFYFCYEIMDEKGLIYNKEVEVLVNFIKNPAITLKGIDFINEHGERIRYDSDSKSHYFMDKMTISPMIEITYYTSEDIEFQLYTKADSGSKINSHGEIKTKKCLNSDAFGKISKQGITITYNFLTNVSIDRSNYTIQTDQTDKFINLNWYLKYTLTKIGQQLDTSNNLLKSKGHFLQPPKITEAKIEASTGTGITFFVAAIKPSSTMANPSTTDTIFELIGDVDDTIIKSDTVIFENDTITFSAPLLNTVSVKVKVSYEHTVSFSENGKDYSFTAIEFTETSETTLTGPTPTVVYRKNCVGINTIKPEEYAKAAFVVSPYVDAAKAADYSKVYFVKNNGNGLLGTIDLETLAMMNFIIDCGSW